MLSRQSKYVVLNYKNKIKTRKLTRLSQLYQILKITLNFKLMCIIKQAHKI